MNTQKCISDADLGRLLEDDVTSQEKQTLQQHIDTCPDCKGRWQRMSAGVQHIEAFLSDKAGKALMTGGCLSEEVLTEFIDETLNQEDKQTAEEHLSQCSRCREALADGFSDAYEKNGDTWWSQYVAEQILRLFAEIPDQIDSLLEDIKTIKEEVTPSLQLIELPIFEPTESDVERLAAATGEGLSEQRLHQNDPPFDFHLVQFGRQLRIGLQTAGEDSTYENCLGRLELYETDTCKYSQAILIEKGQGQCIIEPDDVCVLRPQQGQLAVKFVPIVTLVDLASAGPEVYKPIFAKLLRHKDPRIRRIVVEVVARIYGAQASSLISHLAEDTDGSVRSAVQEVMKRFQKL